MVRLFALSPTRTAYSIKSPYGFYCARKFLSDRGCMFRARRMRRVIEVLNVKQTMFILLLFASLPDCGQNQTAVSDHVSDEQYMYSSTRYYYLTSIHNTTRVIH